MILIDAKDQILGRLASEIAKLLLNGETVSVVNAEKAIITGNPEMVFKEFRVKRARGDPYHGPFYPKSPEMVFKRTVRGMLPYRMARGGQAFKRFRAFISIPAELQGKEFTVIEGTKNKGEHKFVTLAKIAERL
jgi:large subunit ribosomal protein L13